MKRTDANRKRDFGCFAKGKRATRCFMDVTNVTCLGRQQYIVENA